MDGSRPLKRGREHKEKKVIVISEAGGLKGLGDAVPKIYEILYSLKVQKCYQMQDLGCISAAVY